MSLTLIALLVLFQIKHMLADYFLQTGFMLRGRAIYLHVGRAAHAGVHGVGTALVFLVVGTAPLFALALAVLDWVIHFHVDWAKARLTEGRGLSPTDAGFWRAAGMDQAAHHLTYVLLLVIWAGGVA